MRDRSWRRSQRDRVIKRKINTIKVARNYWNYTRTGSLDKGKIHCSCPRCKYWRKLPTTGMKLLTKIHQMEIKNYGDLVQTGEQLDCDSSVSQFEPGRSHQL